MEKKDLIDLFKIQIGLKSLEPYISDAVDIIHTSRGGGWDAGMSKGDRNDLIIQVATAIKSMIKKGDKLDRENILDAIRPDNTIKTSELIKKITPRIKEIRMGLYGNEDPLFPNNIDKIVDWIKEEAKKQAFPLEQDVERNKEKIINLENEIKFKIKELSRLSYRENRLLTEENPTIPVPLKIKGKFTGYQNYVWIWPRTKIARFEGEMRNLSKQTNFSQLALIIYVFTGIKPFSFSYKISKEFMIGVWSSIGIKIYRDVNDKEFIRLFHEVKKFFKRPGKQLKEKHQRINNLVDKLGGIPPTGKMKFWEKFRQEWNKLYPDPKEQYNSSRGPRKAFLTINKRLQHLFSTRRMPE